MLPIKALEELEPGTELHRAALVRFFCPLAVIVVDGIGCCLPERGIHGIAECDGEGSGIGCLLRRSNGLRRRAGMGNRDHDRAGVESLRRCVVELVRGVDGRRDSELAVEHILCRHHRCLRSATCHEVDMRCLASLHPLPDCRGGGFDLVDVLLLHMMPSYITFYYDILLYIMSHDVLSISNSAWKQIANKWEANPRQRPRCRQKTQGEAGDSPAFPQAAPCKRCRLALQNCSIPA